MSEFANLVATVFFNSLVYVEENQLFGSCAVQVLSLKFSTYYKHAVQRRHGEAAAFPVQSCGVLACVCGRSE